MPLMSSDNPAEALMNARRLPKTAVKLPRPVPPPKRK